MPCAGAAPDASTQTAAYEPSVSPVIARSTVAGSDEILWRSATQITLGTGGASIGPPSSTAGAG